MVFNMSEQKSYIKTSDENGSINISEDVIAAIVAAAVTDVKGVFGLYYSPSPSKEFMRTISRKEISKSVKLIIEGDDIFVNVYILLARDYAANEVGCDVQKAVISAVEDAIGVVVCEVNVHICGVATKSKPPSAAKAAQSTASL